MIFVYNHIYDLYLVELFLFYVFYYTGTARALGLLPWHLDSLLPSRPWVAHSLCEKDFSPAQSQTLGLPVCVINSKNSGASRRPSKRPWLNSSSELCLQWNAARSGGTAVWMINVPGPGPLSTESNLRDRDTPELTQDFSRGLLKWGDSVRAQAALLEDGSTHSGRAVGSSQGEHS